MSYVLHKECHRSNVVIRSGNTRLSDYLDDLVFIPFMITLHKKVISCTQNSSGLLVTTKSMLQEAQEVLVQSRCYFDGLPDEVIVMIINQMGITDSAKFGQTCRRFNKIYKIVPKMIHLSEIPLSERKKHELISLCVQGQFKLKSLETPPYFDRIITLDLSQHRLQRLVFEGMCLTPEQLIILICSSIVELQLLWISLTSFAEKENALFKCIESSFHRRKIFSLTFNSNSEYETSQHLGALIYNLILSNPVIFNKLLHLYFPIRLPVDGIDPRFTINFRTHFPKVTAWRFVLESNVENGADVDAQTLTLSGIQQRLVNQHGYSLLHLRFIQRKYDRASELIESGEYDIYQTDTNGQNLLLFLLTHDEIDRDDELAQKLILKIVDRYCDQFCQDPLNHIERGIFQIDSRGRSCLMLLFDQVKLLFSQNVAFFQSLFDKLLPLFKTNTSVLLQRDSEGQNALMVALFNRVPIEIVQTLWGVFKNHQDSLFICDNNDSNVLIHVFSALNCNDPNQDQFFGYLNIAREIASIYFKKNISGFIEENKDLETPFSVAYQQLLHTDESTKLFKTIVDAIENYGLKHFLEDFFETLDEDEEAFRLLQEFCPEIYAKYRSGNT